MDKPIIQFYEIQEEPVKSCYMALRQVFLTYNSAITEEWKYGLPFFYYAKKPLCYLWKDKKTLHPYIGFVDGILMDHPMLEQGNRKRMKVLSIDPNEDLPIETLYELLEIAIRLKS
ncbi:protein of unknown function (DU1801) [Spirosomataceae bacterium TFI 002]|nr:protein of unknown function (DU1801) [Spirosomataceae bacterium TFI 002]